MNDERRGAGGALSPNGLIYFVAAAKALEAVAAEAAERVKGFCGHATPTIHACFAAPRH